MKQLVKLWQRPSSDGLSYIFYLIYIDTDGRRRQKSLGHADKRKAERQRAQLERELRMGVVRPDSMKLSVFIDDSLRRTGNQLRESTKKEYRSAMQDFINTISDKDFMSVTIDDGERYRESCLEKGNSPATVRKKLTEIKAVFQLAVRRRQLDDNPLRYIKMPRCSQSTIAVYSDSECQRMIRAANDIVSQSDLDSAVRWDLLILMALTTGMRRGELLNLTWADVDFENQAITVSPKDDTKETWLWKVKDTDRRTLPLTDGLVQMLADHQNRQLEGYPYVFVPTQRYDFIQSQLRAKGKWTYSDSRMKVVNNFTRDCNLLLKRAAVPKKQFHDLRRTAICNWLSEGMKEHEVMRLAGHSKFETTHKYYLAVHDNLLDRARAATDRGLCRDLLQNCCSGIVEKPIKKADNRKCLSAKDLRNGQRRT